MQGLLRQVASPHGFAQGAPTERTTVEYQPSRMPNGRRKEAKIKGAVRRSSSGVRRVVATENWLEGSKKGTVA